MSLPSLPSELWLAIFRWATLSLSASRLCATTYSPFNISIPEDRDEGIAVKCAIIRVCRRWNTLAAQLIYEDIFIHRDYAGIVRERLQHNETQETRGFSWAVRRVSLPYSSSVTQAGMTCPIADAIEILRTCPKLEVLVRPGSYYGSELGTLPFEFPAENCPPLPSLKRLDWWHHNDAARTGGVNSLPDVLAAAPNLQYLSLGGELWLSLLGKSLIHLPNLTTLRIRRMNILFIQQICRWDLPLLRHLVLDTVWSANPLHLTWIWDAFKDQLHTVELGKNLKFYVFDAVRSVLEACPKLKELNYHLTFTTIPSPLSNRHEFLDTVGINVSPIFMSEGSAQYWEHLEGHFDSFCRPSFPRLGRIVLYGDWKAILSDPRYDPIADKLRRRGISLEVGPK